MKRLVWGALALGWSMLTPAVGWCDSSEKPDYRSQNYNAAASAVWGLKPFGEKSACFSPLSLWFTLGLAEAGAQGRPPVNFIDFSIWSLAATASLWLRFSSRSGSPERRAPFARRARLGFPPATKRARGSLPPTHSVSRLWVDRFARSISKIPLAQPVKSIAGPTKAPTGR